MSDFYNLTDETRAILRSVPSGSNLSIKPHATAGCGVRSADGVFICTRMVHTDYVPFVGRVE